MNFGILLLHVVTCWPSVMRPTDQPEEELQGASGWITRRAELEPCQEERGFPGNGWGRLSFAPAGEGSSGQAEGDMWVPLLPFGSTCSPPHTALSHLPPMNPWLQPCQNLTPPRTSNNNPGACRALLLLDAGSGAGAFTT